MNTSLRTVFSFALALAFAALTSLYVGCGGGTPKCSPECKSTQTCRASADGKTASCVDKTTPDGSTGDQPPADQPPADQPPADQPPADQPPADQPPADQPPADQPPADQPPADQPPADQPPADQPSGSKDVGEICTQSQTNPAGDCKAGHLCLGISQTPPKAVCFQDCTANPNVCAANTADGRTQCVDGTQTAKICFGADADKDKPCGLETKSQADCKSGQTPPLYCSPASKTCKEVVVQTTEGSPCSRENDTTEPPKICDIKLALVCDDQTATCKKGTVQATLGKCNAAQSLVCGQNDVCVRFSDQAGDNSFCMKTCDPKAPNCTSGECTPLSDPTQGICLPPGDAPDYAECKNADLKKDVYDPKGTCQAAESVCAGINGTTPICFRAWSGDCQTPGKTCKTGEICVPLQASTSTFGSCFKDCTADAAVCTGVTECSSLGSKICLGKKPVGPVPFGGVCDTDPANATTKGCQAGFECLAAANVANGFCSKDCTAAGSTCPTITDGGNSFPTNCNIELQSGAKFCGVACNQPGQTCPTGLVCEQSLGFCIANNP